MKLKKKVTVPGFYAVKRPYWSTPRIYQLHDDRETWENVSGYKSKERFDKDARFIGPLKF
jgi:hypothetical protein